MSLGKSNNSTRTNSTIKINRRRLLGGLTGAAAGLIAGPALAGWTTSVQPRASAFSPIPKRKPGLFTATPPSGTGERRLSFFQIHTGERFDDVYWADGEYVRENLDQVSNLMRDYKAEQITQIDPALLDLLYEVRSRLDTDEAITVFSAYRSPQTNAAMRKRSRGVAKNSYHMLGQALDMAVEGRKNSDIRKIALAMEKGGVGYYRRRSFIHLDVGPVRSWRRG